MRAYFVVPVVAALVLACGGEPEVSAVPGITSPPLVEGKTPDAVPAGTPATEISAPLIVSGAPVGTDEASFVEKEIGAVVAVVPFVNEMSGETVGNNYSIAENRTIRGVVCSATSPILVNTDGVWTCSLGAPWQTQGFTFQKDELVAFQLASTHARQVTLGGSGPIVISGIPCSAYALFDADGQLTETTLGADHTFQGGLTVPVGTMINVDPKGNLLTAHLMAAATVRGKPYGEMFQLQFNEAGDVTDAGEIQGD